MSSYIVRSLFGQGACRPNIKNLCAWSLLHDLVLHDLVADKNHARVNAFAENLCRRHIRRQSYDKKHVKRNVGSEKGYTLSRPCHTTRLHKVNLTKSIGKHFSSTSEKIKCKGLKRKSKLRITDKMNIKVRKRIRSLLRQSHQSRNNAAGHLKLDDSSINTSQSKSVDQIVSRQIDLNGGNLTRNLISDNPSIEISQPESVDHTTSRQPDLKSYKAAENLTSDASSIETKQTRSGNNFAPRQIDSSRSNTARDLIPENSLISMKQSKSIDHTTPRQGVSTRYNSAGYLILEDSSINRSQEKFVDQTAGRQNLPYSKTAIQLYLENYAKSNRENASKSSDFLLRHKREQLMSFDDDIFEKDTVFFEPFKAHDHELELLEREKKLRQFFNETTAETGINLETQRELQSERIHILGMGPKGQYIAHCISRLKHAPPIILLMHRPLMMQTWHDEGAAIQVQYEDKIFSQGGFHIESSANFRRTSPYQRFVGFGKFLEHTSEPPSYTIDTLIITTESSITIPALASIKHRIKSTTTVCIIQEGLGIVQKLNKIIFTDQAQRPTYVLGYLKVKLATTENVFTHRQTGPSIFYCSKLPRLKITQSESQAPITRVDFSWPPEAKHLVATLARIPELNTKALGHKDYHKRHLLRVVFGAVIEPLTVAFDCANKHLLYNSEIYQIMKVLIEEISMIFTSLPELRNIKNVSIEFGAYNLEKRVITRIRQSENIVSPMLRHVRLGRKTEIDFFTGYVIERARQLNIACPNNQMMYNLVRGKERLIKRINDNYIPFK